MQAGTMGPFILQALTDEFLANMIPRTPQLPGCYLELLCFPPFPERSLLHALCRREACDTISPALGLPQGSVPQPAGRESQFLLKLTACIQVVVSQHQIDKNYFSSFTVCPDFFSLCFLVEWGPLHSHYRNLSALFDYFVAKTSAYDWALKSI